jgi:hypothetical protein
MPEQGMSIYDGLVAHMVMMLGFNVILYCANEKCRYCGTGCVFQFLVEN